MATDARIALMGQPINMQQALTTSIGQAEQLRTRGVREQILQQQQQQAAMDIASKQGQYLNQLASGLMSKPLDQRAAIVAQQLPFLQQLGINPAQVLGQDLTNQGLQSVIMQTQPFMQAQAGAGAAPAGVQEFQFLTEGLTPEQVEQARLVELGLVPRAGSMSGAKTVKMPDGTIRTFDPNTNTFGPVIESTGAGEAQVVTPEQQIEAQAKAVETIGEAETKVAVEEAVQKEEALQTVRAETPEAIESRNKSISSSMKVVSNIDAILSSDRLDDIAGAKGVLPTLRPKTKDLINTVSQLSSLLTVENLGIMSGVLSESDMKIIKGIANDIGIKFDNEGNVLGFSGSLEGTVGKLRQLKTEIANGLRRQGYGLEGDVATNPATGERVIFQNFEWVPMQ